MVQRLKLGRHTENVEERKTAKNEELNSDILCFIKLLVVLFHEIYGRAGKLRKKNIHWKYRL
jgi:hypothetical protein